MVIMKIELSCYVKEVIEIEGNTLSDVQAGELKENFLDQVVGRLIINSIYMKMADE